MSNGLNGHGLTKTKPKWSDHIRPKIKSCPIGLKPIKSKLDGLKPFGHGRPIWNSLWFYLEWYILGLDNLDIPIGHGQPN